MMEDGEPVAMKRAQKGTSNRLEAHYVPAGIAGGWGVKPYLEGD